MMRPTATRMATPPTTPPAIAPTGVLLPPLSLFSSPSSFWGAPVTVVVDAAVVDFDEASAVDSSVLDASVVARAGKTSTPSVDCSKSLTPSGKFMLLKPDCVWQGYFSMLLGK